MVVPALADGPFYGDPPDATHPWAIHDMNRPRPPVVEAGTFSSQQQAGRAPSDAVVLFDGTPASLANWESGKQPGKPAPWEIKDGVLQVVPGSGEIRSREAFGDCQLHVEWCAPEKAGGASQGRSNSGIILAGDTEVQVLDNYDNPSYADGYAGSVYGVNPPHANPLNAPGQWQVYDIIFRRPVFKNEKMLDSGRLTVLVNGVVVQDSTPLEGGGGHLRRNHDRAFPETAPLKLQDHGNPIRFRNIWYRALPKRAVEGGDMGAMEPAAAAAKKREIAEAIRTDAATKQGLDRLLRVMESLCYEQDPGAIAAVDKDLSAWVDAAEKTPAKEMEARKGEIMRTYQAVRYLSQHQLYQDKPGNRAKLEKLIRANGWDPK